MVIYKTSESLHTAGQMKTLIVIVLILHNVLLPQKSNTLIIGERLFKSTFSELYLDDITISDTRIELGFYFINSAASFSDEDCLVSAVYSDNYDKVSVQDITIGNNFSLSPRMKKEFTVSISRPADILAIKGSIGGLAFDSKIKLSKNASQSASIDISSAVEKIPLSEKPESLTTTVEVNEDEQKFDPEYMIHVVKRGHSINWIAMKYGVSLRTIATFNPYIKNYQSLRIGQELKIPVRRGNQVADAYSKWSKKIYTVKKGDTLGYIAKEYGVMASSIRVWNGIQFGDYLTPGQKLVIYYPIDATRQTKETIDTTSPTIELLNPSLIQNIFRTEEASVIIRGKTSDSEGIAFVEIDGKNANLKADGTFMTRTRLKFGKNTIQIRSTDINDNIKSKEFFVIRDEFIDTDEFSDVDFPPETGNINSNGIAVVFGVEEYEYAPAVPYAFNDADIFREYLVTTFGLRRENIYFKTNDRATKGEFEKAFSENGWLANRSNDLTDVFVYYAGHGAPDMKSKDTYLIPHDIDPNYASTGYSLDEFYTNMSKMNARSITVILDACFSGGTRDNKSLFADSRPVFISIKAGIIPANVTVFSAALGNEISSGYKQKNHGIFTYFYLKGLNGEADLDKDKKITVTEMQNYLSENVSAQAQKMGREQHPQLLGAQAKRVMLEY